MRGQRGRGAAHIFRIISPLVANSTEGNLSMDENRTTAWGYDFNRSMQHLISNTREENGENEAMSGR